MNIQWADRLAGLDSSAIQEILQIAQRGDVISFAGGLPSAKSFPVENLAASYQAALTTQGAVALQYAVTEGYQPLREWIADHLSKQGINCSADNVLITNGSQQVLDIVCRVLINPGDAIAVENPAYLSAVQVFKAAQARLIPIPVGSQGMDVDYLATVLKTERPKFIYVNPTFQNPTGATMPLAKRQQLIQLAAQHEIPIIEDNPYGELRFDGIHEPPVKSLPGGEWVLYAGTISKIVAPGLRIGWLVADKAFMDHLSTTKQLNDMCTNSITQRALYHYLTNNDVIAHIQTIIEQYRHQRDVMLDAMNRHFPAAVARQIPEGGMFVWATLPENIDTAKLLREAVDHKVAFVPGAPFHVDGTGHNTMRINFSNSSPELIETGIERLGKLLKQKMNNL